MLLGVGGIADDFEDEDFFPPRAFSIGFTIAETDETPVLAGELVHVGIHGGNFAISAGLEGAARIGDAVGGVLQGLAVIGLTEFGENFGAAIVEERAGDFVGGVTGVFGGGTADFNEDLTLIGAAAFFDFFENGGVNDCVRQLFDAAEVEREGVVDGAGAFLNKKCHDGAGGLRACVVENRCWHGRNGGQSIYAVRRRQLGASSRAKSLLAM